MKSNLQSFKQSIDEKNSELQADLTLYEDQMNKKKLYWENHKKKYLQELQDKKIIFYEEKDTIATQLKEEEALIQFNYIQLSEYFEKQSLILLQKKMI